MSGFAHDGNGNELVYTSNVDFSGGATPTGQVLQNGQLLIGSAIQPNIQVGRLTSPAATMTIGYANPNVTVDWAPITTNSLIVGSGVSAPTLIANGTTGQVLTATTGSPPSWSGIPFAPNKYIYIFDDFIGISPNATLTQQTGQLSWYDAGNNWTLGATTGDSGHNGVIANIALPAANQSLFLNNSVGAIGPQMILGGGAITLNWVIKVVTLSTVTNRYTLRVGLGTTENADQVNGVYFEYSDNINSGQWNFKTASASTRTTSTSSVTVTTAYHNLAITINAAGTSCAFAVDGVSLGTAIATNIPSVAITPFVDIVRSAGTIAAGSILIDLMYFTQTLTTAR